MRNGFNSIRLDGKAGYAVRGAAIVFYDTRMTRLRIRYIFSNTNKS